MENIKMQGHQKSSKIKSVNHINRGKIETYNTKIHDRLLSWLGTVISIKRYGVRDPNFPSHIIGWAALLQRRPNPHFEQYNYSSWHLRSCYMNNTMSIKDNRWHQPSFKSCIVNKATGRHRMGTMVNIKPIFNS